MLKKVLFPIQLLILQALLLLSSCDKKDEVTPVDATSYAYVKAEHRNVVIEDDFSNNTNNWQLANEPDYLLEITNNFYRLQSKSNSSTASYKYIDFDYTKNFEIELQMKSNAPATFFSFSFNHETGFANTVSFDYGSKKLTYTKLQNHVFTDLSTTENVVGLEAGKSIKLTVRKIGQDVYLFINEKMIAKTAYTASAGTGIILRTGDQTLTEVDKFRLTYLNIQ